MVKKVAAVEEIVIANDEVETAIIASCHLQKAMKSIGKEFDALDAKNAQLFIGHLRAIKTTKDPKTMYRSALYSTLQDIAPGHGNAWRSRLLTELDKVLSPKKSDNRA